MLPWPRPPQMHLSRRSSSALASTLHVLPIPDRSPYGMTPLDVVVIRHPQSSDPVRLQMINPKPIQVGP